jgi:hypothetical protein
MSELDINGYITRECDNCGEVHRFACFLHNGVPVKWCEECVWIKTKVRL